VAGEAGEAGEAEGRVARLREGEAAWLRPWLSTSIFRDPGLYFERTKVHKTFIIK
jgi:hypothetical protein